jgi:dihydrofolate synthase/folylpolyglutamate synthase
MQYTELLQRLFHINLFGGIKLGLENCHHLSRVLNSPYQHFHSIHVAGTNGKGSVTTKIAKALELAGYRTGLYTSPHISTFRERIQVNGQMISEDAVVRHLSFLFDIAEMKKISATFFEITTFLAFLYFLEQKVDVAIIETGLGGRLDATNVITPLLSVITSISLDHTETLGKRIEDITREKGGIIKPNVPILIGPCVSEDIIRNIANSKNASLYLVKGTFPSYDIENQAIARASLKLLSNSFSVTSSHIEAGMLVRPPCRLEILTNFSTPVILDVGHNPNGLQRLFETIRQKYPDQPLRIVFGLSKSKDIDACLNVLSTQANAFHLVEAVNGRGASVESLKAKMLAQGISEKNIFQSVSIEETVQNSLKKAEANNEIVVICGTFFIMSAARRALGICEPIDSIDMNERTR